MVKLFKDNRGFMMAEVVIVSAILITTIVGLYAGFASVYQAYEARSDYYDVDSLYALKNLEDFLIDEFIFNNLVSVNNFTYVEINTDTVSDEYQKKYLEEFFDNYNVDKIFLAVNTTTALNSITSSDEMEDYIDFVVSEIDTSYKYILMLETQAGTMASLRIK